MVSVEPEQKPVPVRLFIQNRAGVLRPGLKGDFVLKKIVALVLTICLLACTAALAENSQFGILAANEYADERMAALDREAEQLSIMKNVNGVTVIVGQGYCEKDRVFFSYRICADTDLITLHEGAPAAGLTWTKTLDDWVEGEIPAWYPTVKKEHDWLDGKGQRWVESPDCKVYSLYLADGTLTLTTGGSEDIQADGSVVGWRECVIPEDKTEDAVSFDFELKVGCDRITKFQDGRNYREHREPGKEVMIPFTLKRNTDTVHILGETTTEQFRAIGGLWLSKVDSRGSLQVDDPELVKARREGIGGDQIISWSLYRNSEPLYQVTEQDTVDGGDETLFFELKFPAVSDPEGLNLVPEYSQSGPHPDEAVRLWITE